MNRAARFTIAIAGLLTATACGTEPGSTGTSITEPEGPYCCALIERSLNCGWQYSTARAERAAIFELALAGDETACELQWNDYVLENADSTCNDIVPLENYNTCAESPSTGLEHWARAQEPVDRGVAGGFPQLTGEVSGALDFSLGNVPFTYKSYGTGFWYDNYDSQYTAGFQDENGDITSFQNDYFWINLKELTPGTYAGNTNTAPASTLFAIGDDYWSSEADSYFCPESFITIVVEGTSDQAVWGTMEGTLCTLGNYRTVSGKFSSLKPEIRALY